MPSPSTRTRPDPRATKPPARIDPRLRDRRVAVKREAGRRRLNRLLMVLGALGVVGLVVALSFSALTDVDHVEVEGATHTDTAAVRAAAGLAGASMMWLDPDAAATRVQALPWVDTATIRRGWPGTVHVVVKERTAVAWIALGASVALVDGTGRVLGTQPADAVGRPRVELTGTATVPSPGKTLASANAADVAARLTEPLSTRAVVVQAEPLVVFLDDGTEVRLGDSRSIPEKIEAADAVLAARGDAPFRYIDVRVPTAPAVGV